MKIGVKKYAESLIEVLDGKSKDEAKASIAKLLEVMKDNGDAKQIPSLVTAFEKLWDEKYNIPEIEVTTALEIDNASKKVIEKYVKEKMNVEKVEMNLRVDKKILGGVIIRDGDRVYDGSLKTRLYELKNRLVK